jgi:cyclophilin family peptidyl-prolyl cis-trans isomerase
MLRLFSRLSRRRSSTASAASTAPAPKPAVEELEGRAMFAVAPYVTSIVSDNRGEVILNTSRSLNPATVTTASVFLFSTGVDGIPLTPDDVKMRIKPTYTESNRQLRVRTFALDAGATYFVKFSAKLIMAYDGAKLDGEFNGPGVRTGNGVGGGDLLFVSKRDRSTRPVARVSTSYGAMNVSLFKDLTPQTVDNFFHYANEAAWDGTFFHRNVQGFITQGGGFAIHADNSLSAIHQEAQVPNEFQAGVTTNIRGRIAMAKLDPDAPGGGPDSATNQWFFSAADNRANLDNQNGGFAAFGEINSAAGLAVLDAIQGLTSLNGVPLPGLGSFDDVPLNDAAAAQARGFIDPQADLVSVRRVAILNKISALVV